MATKPSRKPVPNSSTIADRGKPSNGHAVPVEDVGDPVEEAPPPIPTGDLRLVLSRKSPGTKYLDAIRMERLFNKLVLLNYTNALANGTRNIGLPRDYFLADKPEYVVERFHVFASLSAWMIGQLGVEIPRPKERDDPNVTVANITDGLRKLNIPMDTTAHRLKSGSGSEVIGILYELASGCLKKHQEFQVPAFLDAAESSTTAADEDEEDDQNEEEEEYQAIPFFDWEQEEVAEDLMEGDLDAKEQQQTAAEIEAKQRAAEEWRLEADRMAPFFNRPDGGASDRLGWSDRIRKLDLCRKELDQNVETVNSKLSGIITEIARSTEKIENREKYISVNHREKVERYRTANAKLEAAKAKYESHNSQVESHAQKLAEVTAEFEKLKRRVEDKGNSGNDRAAISNMRAAMKRMKEEMGLYNIKCALAELRLQELAELLQNAEIEENLTNIETVGILPGTRN